MKILRETYVTEGMSKKDIYRFRQMMSNCFTLPDMCKEEYEIDNPTYHYSRHVTLLCDPEKNGKEPYECHIIEVADTDTREIFLFKTSSEIFMNELNNLIADFGDDPAGIDFQILSGESKNYAGKKYYKPVVC